MIGRTKKLTEMSRNQRIDFGLHAHDSIEALLMQPSTFNNLNALFNEIDASFIQFIWEENEAYVRFSV